MLDQRLEFVLLALQKGAKIAPLARKFGISRKTAHKWLTRYRTQGLAGLTNRSHCPKRFYQQTPAAMEQAVMDQRETHQVWGGRKLRRIMQDQQAAGTLQGVDGLVIPSASTITRILDRHHVLSDTASHAHASNTRFERGECNELFQMDFKGDVTLGNRQHAYPLTIMDDKSRFNLCLQACADQRHDTVVAHLRTVFRQYGLPRAMLTDNGTPWAHSHGAFTRMEVLMLRLGIQVIHGRAYHPQTQGKEERFHRTLKTEVLNGRVYADMAALQEALDHWRPIYNYVRPHEALGLDTPGSHYHISERAYPETLPVIEYDEGEIVRRVRKTGYFNFKGRSWYLSETLGGECIALRPTQKDGVYAVCYGAFAVGVLDCTQEQNSKTPYQRIQRYRSARQIGSCEYPVQVDGEYEI